MKLGTYGEFDSFNFDFVSDQFDLEECGRIFLETLFDNYYFSCVDEDTGDPVNNYSFYMGLFQVVVNVPNKNEFLMQWKAEKRADLLNITPSHDPEYHYIHSNIFTSQQLEALGEYISNAEYIEVHFGIFGWTDTYTTTEVRPCDWDESGVEVYVNEIEVNDFAFYVNGNVVRVLTMDLYNHIEHYTLDIEYSNNLGSIIYSLDSTDDASRLTEIGLGFNETEIDISDLTSADHIFGSGYVQVDVVVIRQPYLELNGNPNDLYLRDTDHPLVVPMAGATFNDSIIAIARTGNTMSTQTNNLTLNRTITHNESKTAMGGNAVGVVSHTATVSWEYKYNQSNYYKRTYNLSSNVKVYTQIKKPVSIQITGSDSNTYYQGRDNTFVTPSGLTYKFLYNDNSEVSRTTESLKFKLLRSSEASELVSGSSIIPSGTTTIYVESTITYDDVSYTVYGSYPLQTTPDTIVNLSLIEVETITLGNALNTNDLVVQAAYESGAIETLSSSEFSIKSPSNVLTEAFTSLTLTCKGTDYSFNSTALDAANDGQGITFVVPTINAISISNNLVTAYNNIVSSIDLREVVLTISYTGATFTNQVTLGGAASQLLYEVVAKYNNSNIFDSESINNYNGTTSLNISSLTSGSVSCVFTFTVKSYFNSTTKTKDVNFTVLAMTEIKGIKIQNPYTDYRVGDRFLEKAEDQTEMVLYWEDNGVLQYRAVPLKSGYASIGIYPQIGTELKNINYSKQIEIKSVLNSSISAEYQIQVLPRNINADSTILDLVPVWQTSVTCPNGETISSEKGVLVFYKRTDVGRDIYGVNYLVNNNARKYGYVKDILDKDKNAVVVLFDDYIPPIRSAANAEITFPSYEEGEADLINKCTFGILFGANNSVNRLFVSGNPDVGNADWHTSQLNLTDYEGDELLSLNGNFSYFTSAGVMYYGESDNKVIGYDIISDDKLLVLKNKSDKEKTVYFRTPITLKAVDATGSVSTDIEGNSQTMEEFGLIKGNNSVAGVSPFSICNFNGDTLFVDADNQVSGLDLTGIVGDRQRYANSRSKYIDYRLKDLDLSSATLWNNNKYLYLSIPNVGLFVSHFEAKENNQYDWWFLTSDNPKVFLDYNDKVYFGNDDGTLGVLENGTQKDIRKVFADADQTTLVSILPSEERVLLSNDIMEKLSSEKVYKFKVIPDSDYKHNIYFEIAQAYATDDPVNVKIDWENDTFVGGNFRENKIYYLNYIEENVDENLLIDVNQSSIIAEYGRPFKFKQVSIDDEEYDDEKVSYFLIDANSGLRVTGFETIEFNEVSICERLDEDVDVAELDFERNTFQIKRDGEVLNVITYGLQNPSERTIKAEIREYDGVEAYYITAPFFANTLNTFKTIWQITLTNDTDIASSLKVGVASNKVPFYDSKDLAHTARGDLGINLNSMDFSKTDFDKKVVPRTYTMNRVLGMQKFLCLAFKNEKGNNAVLSEMAITYTLPFPSYGSD